MEVPESLSCEAAAGESPASEPSEKVYVFVCKGESCSKKGNVERMRVLLKQATREFPAKSVKVVYVSCLGLCGQGPNVLVSRGGTVFNHRTEPETGDIIEKVRGNLAGQPA